MYHLELAYRPANGSTLDMDGVPIAFKFCGNTETREEADIMAEMLCDRRSTVYVNLWYERSPEEDCELIATCDGFHS